jgi:hypothetical protein
MQRRLNTFLLSRNNDSIPAAIAGFLLIQLLSRHGGIGISPDSVVYLSTAQNIHDHGAINDFTNTPMMDFPAFYPVFLSGIIFLTGRGVPAFGPILNGLLFALLIWLCGWMMDRFTRGSRWYKWTLLLFIVGSPCLLEVYSMIWSETLFLLLSVLFMIGCHRYFQRHSTASLLLIAVIAGLVAVTRYAGVSIIAMGGLLMLCDGRLRWGPRKIAHLALYGLVSVSFLAWNIYRNYKVTGTFTGYREKGLTSLVTNLHDFGSVLCDWLPFFNERYGWATAIAIGFCLLLTGIFLFRLVRKVNFFSYDTIAISYFVVYAFFILTTATISRFQQLDSRLLSPLFLPWLWGSTCWMPAIPEFFRSRSAAGPGHEAPASRTPVDPGRWKKGWLLAALLGTGCFLWGEWSAFRFNWTGIKYAGIPGYTEDTWQQSATMAYVRANRDKLRQAGHIYSSAYEGLWFLGNVSAEIIPHKDNPDDIRYMMIDNHFSVVWFNDSINDDLIDIDYIKAHKLLVEEHDFNDGAVYFFRTAKGVASH